MKKKILVASSAVLLCILMTGCAATPKNSSTNPVVVGSHTSSGNSNSYSEAWVRLSDGRLVLCLYYEKDSKYATMSCDFGVESEKR